MALTTRGSERIGNFRWVCRGCGEVRGVFGGACRECSWNEPVSRVRNPRNMDVEVHRSARTFYPHHVVLLNQPRRELATFLEMEHWQAIVAATFLGFDEVGDRRLIDFVKETGVEHGNAQFGLSDDDMETLRSGGYTEDQIADFLHMQRQLATGVGQSAKAISPRDMSQMLVSRTGVRLEIWNRAGFELLEAVMPFQEGLVRQVFSENAGLESAENARDWARSVGAEQISLISDFPITTAVYGYSRADYRPNLCHVNPFPPDREQDGRYPIYVDTVQADAIMLHLDIDRVVAWLETNGFASGLSSRSVFEKRAYFVNLFDQAPLRQTIKSDEPETRLVFGLLHTLSHLSLRSAAMLCGLDRTSLSEYVLPRALMFAIYSSHRFGATIGAFTALYEQALVEWLEHIRNSRRCVYDPVCHDNGGNCHACTHIAEISCQYFNLNLGRPFLFGGHDPEVGRISVGYLDV